MSLPVPSTSEATFLYLIRHGESEWNRQHRLTGWSDIDLTEKGRTQARGVRQLLAETQFDGVWSSDLRRAVETGRLAHSEPAQDRRLRELNFGRLEGKTWEDISEADRVRIQLFEGFQAPGGESLADLQGRVRDFIATLRHGKHLLFTHGGVIRSILRPLGDQGYVSNCAVVCVDWSNQQVLSHESAPGWPNP